MAIVPNKNSEIMKKLLLIAFLAISFTSSAQTKQKLDYWFISYLSDFNRGSTIVAIRKGSVPSESDCKVFVANYFKIDTIKLNIMACYKTNLNAKLFYKSKSNIKIIR